MREHYDFSKAKRGAVVPSPGKTRITIMLDDDVIEHFRAQAEQAGVGYQTLINALLRQAVLTPPEKPQAEPLTVAMLRQVLREELRAV
ncbi:MAG: CopG family transcriptional regulator [Ideonella sp. MAG2]|nr:MAG: CopG family transcriptional regulator [Ideonella sp. MAG2]